MTDKLEVQKPAITAFLPVSSRDSIKCLSDIIKLYNQRRLIITSMRVDGVAVHPDLDFWPTMYTNEDRMIHITHSGGGKVHILGGSKVLDEPRMLAGSGYFEYSFKDELNEVVSLEVRMNPAKSLLSVFERENTQYLTFLSNYNELVVMHLDKEANTVTVNTTKLGLNTVNCKEEEITSRRVLILDETFVVPFDHFYRKWYEVTSDNALKNNIVFMTITDAVLERKK